ncbi:MAG: flagellar assembly protein FliX [Rhodospirillales bacterium]|nr:flagellar assembly protein FliX [Rhodospirillales bacterium]
MKISKVDSSKQAASTKKKKAVATDGEFAEQVLGLAGVGAADAPQAMEGAGSVGAVDSIYAVQEVPDATDGRSKGLLKQFGNDILDSLDELRLAILTGAISKEKLQGLAKKLREKRQLSDDPRLNEIIDEIELRAEVEVAKLTRDF